MKKETFYILPNYAKFRRLGPCHVPFRNRIANVLINNPKDVVTTDGVSGDWDRIDFGWHVNQDRPKNIQFGSFPGYLDSHEKC